MKPTLIFFLLLISQQLIWAQTDDLKAEIQKIISTRNADVGVAVSSLENPKDSLSVNGYKPYPLMSVVKFYVALAILHKVDEKKLFLEQRIKITQADLDPDTYSPMRDQKPKEGFEITLKELLSYAVGQSDNIAYLKLVDLLGDITQVHDFVNGIGVKGVSLVSTYRESFERVLQNTSTPWAAHSLLVKFYKGKILKKESRAILWEMMTETSTGPDRLKGLLPAGTTVAHKTGTAGWHETMGMNMAVNDIGIVTLPKGGYYVIAVFVTKSKENDAENAKIVAEVNKACWDYYTKK